MDKISSQKETMNNEYVAQHIESLSKANLGLEEDKPRRKSNKMQLHSFSGLIRTFPDQSLKEILICFFSSQTCPS